MRQYQKLMWDILESGIDVKDRTGVGTRSLVGNVIQFDMADGFPAMTTKKLAWRAVVGELLWFMQGMTNVEQLRELTHGANSDKKTIWDDNYNAQGVALGYENGELGPIYGKQWRDFGGVDQLTNAIEIIKTNPESRRNIVSAWNPTQLNEMTLPPCHVLYRFYVQNGRLGLTWYQRSADVFLGIPFNIASYALLLHIVAKMTNLEPGILTGMLDDTHIYLNHLEQVDIQLTRKPYDLPSLYIKKNIHSLSDLSDFTVNDFELLDYKHHDPIKAPMAV